MLNKQYADEQSPTWVSDAAGTAVVWILKSYRVTILGQGEGNSFG